VGADRTFTAPAAIEGDLRILVPHAPSKLKARWEKGEKDLPRAWVTPIRPVGLATAGRQEIKEIKRPLTASLRIP
jgi:hypothetical protein